MNLRNRLHLCEFFALVVVSAVAGTALAQPDGGQRRGARGNWMSRMGDRIAEELELDEAQRAEFDQLMSDQREAMRARREQFRALREAEEAGNTERAAELRAELPEGPPHGRNPMGGMMEGLESILREDQATKFSEMRERWQSRGPGRRVERLAEELNLDEDQRQQVEEMSSGLHDRFRSQWSELGPVYRELREAREQGDEARVAELTARAQELRPQRGAIMDEFYEDVETVLREDQLPLLEQARAQRRERRQQWRDGRRGPGRRDRGGLGATGGSAGQVPVLNRIQESLNFGSSLELDEKQREAVDELVKAAQQRQEAEGLSEESVAGTVFEGMKTILRPDQQKALGAFREEVASGSSEGPDVTDIRLVFRAVGKVKLNREQQRQLRTMQKETVKAYRKVRKDREKRVELAKTANTQIIAILDAEQVEDYQRRLERLQRRVKRPSRGIRPDVTRTRTRT